MSDVRDAVAGLLVAVPFLMGAASAPAETQREVFSFADREIDEASGLAVVDGLFVTVNDSGDAGRVFTVDPATGRTVGTTAFDADAVDVEALAPDPDGGVWVGDIGDNLARRGSVSVTRVPVGRDAAAVSVPAYELVYPDGAHDAETLLCDPATGRLYVATKGLLGGTLYAAPAALDADAPNPLTPVGPVLPIATDGAFTPDGQHVVIRDYGRAVVYAWPSLGPVATLDLPDQQQGEAIAVSAADPGTAYVTSEGVGAAVLAVDLPDLAPGPTPSPTPGPTSGPTPAPSSGAALGSVAGSPSSSPTRAPTQSREDRELPESTSTQRSAWPWFLSGWIAVGFLVLLLRSMRRPDRR